MKKIISLFLLTCLLNLTISPALARPFKNYSQLEIRQIQTHTYNTKNSNEVFKAVIHTLQDNGFTIISIEDEMGYIHAKKEFRGKEIDKMRMAGYSLLLAYYIACTALTYGAMAYTMVDPLNRMGNELEKKTIIVDTNANIEPFGKQTRVRLTMVEKILENADGYSFVKSSPRKVIRIYEPALYQVFFNEVDKSIYYESNL